MNESLERAPVGVVEITGAGEIAAVNDAAAALLESPTDALRGQPVESALPRSAAGTLREALAAERAQERSFEEYYPAIDRWLAVDLVPSGDRTFVYLRDRSRRHDDRRRIERLEQRLDRMEAIDAVTATVLRELTETSDREEISRTVCERLGDTDLYAFTWVGERDLADGRLRAVAAAGEAPEMRDRIAEHLSGDGTLPEQRAVADGEARVVQPLAEDDSIPQAVRLAAFGQGLQSCLAVPIAHGDTVYGVVSVYSTRREGFSEGEQASLATLGAVAGFAITAGRREELLFADTVTELTIEVDDRSLPLVAAAEKADAQPSLTGVVPRDDGSVVCYLAIEPPAGPVCRVLDAHGAVRDTRTVGERDGQRALLEVVLAGDSPVVTLAARGATVRTGEATDRGVRVVVELPPDADVRRLVEAVDGSFEGTELLAKRDRPRRPETIGAFRSELEDRLTDRQRTVLRTAYLADYFASPRGSTAEEVGETLDISGATVLYHLRNGQRELLDALFDEGNDRPGD
jgi:hypothetical protein